MSLERKVFHFHESPLEVCIVEDPSTSTKWLKAKEVASFLGYVREDQAIRKKRFQLMR